MQDFKNYLRVLSYLKPYKWLVVVAMLSSFLVAVAFGGTIGGVMPFADILFGDFDLEAYRKLPLMDTELGGALLERVYALLTRDKFITLVLVASGLGLITCFRALFKFIQGYTGAYLANRMRMDISLHLHELMMDQSISFFGKQGVGNIISVFNNDIGLVHRGAKVIFDKILLEPLNIAVALGIAFYLNPRLTALAIVGFPLIGYVINRFGRQIKKNTRKALRNSASILSLLQESLFGIKVIKSFVMEKYERKRFHVENRRLLKNTMRVVRARELMSPLVEIITVVALGLFVLLGGRDVLLGKMTSGRFIAFYVALGAVFGPLRKLSKAVSEIQTSLAGATRTFEFIDRMPEVKDPPDAIEMPSMRGTVVFDNVSFSYDGHKRIIHNVLFDANPGEKVAFVGLSGAGKTTLINLLLRFYDVSEGSICIDGIDIRSVTQSSLRSQVGLVTQETILFNDTVAINISFGRKEFSEEEIVNAAKAANAHEFIEELPEGYNTIIGERGMLLSGGQRQRLAIARTILKDPAIFVLDEATSEQPLLSRTGFRQSGMRTR